MRAFEHKANPQVILFTVMIRQIHIVPQLSRRLLTGHQAAAQNPDKKNTPSSFGQNYTQIHKRFKISNLNTAIRLGLKKEGK